jgi:hypothetical protein
MPTVHFRPARPKYRIHVLLKSGLTNFSGSTDPANPLALKEKFSAGVFCFFMVLYVFNSIQASSAGLFNSKKKEACPARTNKTPRPADTPLKEGNYVPPKI